MLAKHQTFEMSTKDHCALCPRINCNRHAQLYTVSTKCNEQCIHSYTHTLSHKSSPFCTCVGKCTSLWFPERLLGSQSPIFPLNEAGPEWKQYKQAAMRMTDTRTFWHETAAHLVGRFVRWCFSLTTAWLFIQ